MVQKKNSSKDQALSEDGWTVVYQGTHVLTEAGIIEESL